MKATSSKCAFLSLGILLAGAMSSTAVLAQSPSSSTQSPADPSIAQRKENQQDRIANGIKSGQLTAGETSHLETKEAAINGETRADRAANGGKLTAAEKTQINNQQNHLSKEIHKDKTKTGAKHK